MTVEVFLSSGDVALIDDDDAERVLRYKWHVKKRGKLVIGKYAKANIYGAGTGKTIYMHQIIIGKVPGKVIDHVNGNGLDNRKTNLRHVTQSENGANRNHRPFSKHGEFGVCFHAYSQNKGKRWSRSKPWQAIITVSGKDISLGYFATKEEAVLASKRARQARMESAIA